MVSKMQKGLLNWENTLENKSICKNIHCSAAQHWCYPYLRIKKNLVPPIKESFNVSTLKKKPSPRSGIEPEFNKLCSPAPSQLNFMGTCVQTI